MGSRHRRRRRIAALVAAIAMAVWLAPAVGAGSAPGAVSARAAMEEGAAAFQAGALSRAEAAFARAAAVAPGWAAPAVWMGAVAVARRNYSIAAAWFVAALQRHPTMAEEGYARAWLRQLRVVDDRPRMRLRTPDEFAAFARGANPSLTTAQALWVGHALLQAARAVGIDPRLLASVIYVESRFHHQSISSAGAEGLGQLMPETARGIGVDPRDPWQNVLGAAQLLRWDYEEFGAWPLALAAYNAGGNAVRRWNGIPPYPETQWYVWAVLGVYDGLGG